MRNVYMLFVCLCMCFEQKPCKERKANVDRLYVYVYVCVRMYVRMCFDQKPSKMRKANVDRLCVCVVLCVCARVCVCVRRTSVARGSVVSRACLALIKGPGNSWPNLLGLLVFLKINLREREHVN
jgi:hypothetical protein